MKSLMCNNASLAWLGLTSLTAISWALGTGHGFGSARVPASLAITAVAVFKIRLVGWCFMELREAPTALRSVFGCYCVALYLLLSAMYLLA
ncbi:cytochrome C oxidase subunit IV family protein [Mycobacterium vicinigordonae]|uniref:Cytochrome C oxidase subunit IV family protein n=2 Tax=Mycobacterium vicinigordonae TaxID=1719132 RepID=A0A7D6E2X3_9MYCO|nr:cytochrome C oxidase subunit IV family protein [Mycobacterium vicinigordonae]